MRRRLGALLATLALLGGCGAKPAQSVREEVVLSPITHALWQERVQSYRPDVVVVDYWATWCTPCVERFPKMVAMAERYRDRGVRFVSLCLEDRDDAQAVAGAARFLREHDAAFDNFLLDEPLLEAFRSFGLLGIPAVDVYDRSGALHRRLTGDDPDEQFDETDVEAAIEDALAD